MGIRSRLYNGTHHATLECDGGGGLGIGIHMFKEFCHQVTNGAMCYIKCTLGAYEEPTYFVTESGIILSSVPANVMCIAESARLSSGD